MGIFTTAGLTSLAHAVRKFAKLSLWIVNSPARLIFTNFVICLCIGFFWVVYWPLITYNLPNITHCTLSVYADNYFDTMLVYLWRIVVQLSSLIPNNLANLGIESVIQKHWLCQICSMMTKYHYAVYDSWYHKGKTLDVPLQVYPSGHPAITQSIKLLPIFYMRKSRLICLY